LLNWRTDSAPMQRGITNPRLVIAFSVVVAVVVISAFVLTLRPSPQPTTVPLTSSSYVQSSTTTKLVYTDILSQGSLNASITAKVKEIFVIHLAANTGSTGYDWNVSTSGGVRFINYTTTRVGKLPGAPSERDYLFQAEAPGTAAIILVYGRLPPAFSVPQIAKMIHISVEITT
jgi:predicted secreted protein